MSHRWIYRVDRTRVNEFGYAAEPGAQRVEGADNQQAADGEQQQEAAPEEEVPLLEEVSCTLAASVYVHVCLVIGL